jgi:uncharacterized protein (TIGR02284 family)
LEQINNLVNANLELQTAYRAAAEIINDENLKEVLVIYIQKISEFLNELKVLEKDLFGNEGAISFPIEKFSISKSEIDDISILKKCEDLQEKCIKQYKIILDDDVPSSVKEIILKQYNGIEQAGFHLKSFEEIFLR